MGLSGDDAVVAAIPDAAAAAAAAAMGLRVSKPPPGSVVVSEPDREDADASDDFRMMGVTDTWPNSVLDDMPVRRIMLRAPPPVTAEAPPERMASSEAASALAAAWEEEKKAPRSLSHTMDWEMGRITANLLERRVFGSKCLDRSSESRDVAADRDPLHLARHFYHLSNLLHG